MNLVRNYLKIPVSVTLLLIAIISICNLAKSENGLIITKQMANDTPTIIFSPQNTKSNILVFVAHGFAGSTSLMRPIALSLAKTGYKAITFDFLGHGRHSLPYSGDIMNVEGATKVFVRQLNNIITYYLEKEAISKAVIIGHSMASDLIFRTALSNDKIIGAIGISNYTDVIGADKPSNVLIINGMWETRLRAKAVDIMNSIGIADPKEDLVYGSFDIGSARKVSSIKNANHIGILYSIKTQKKVNSWINQITGKNFKVSTNYIGIWVVLLFAALFSLFLILLQNISEKEQKTISISFTGCVRGNLIALILTPFLLSIYSFEWVSFVSHNYLINHLLLYAILAFSFTKGSIKSLSLDCFDLPIFTGLVVFFTLILGYILDQYVSSFYLSGARVPIFFFLLIGCIPITFYIQLFYIDSHAGLWKANMSKICLILSLLFAGIINFSELFLLGYAILLLCVFWLVFGFLGHFLLRRVGSFPSIAFANGVTLAWTFSTALPLYLS